MNRGVVLACCLSAIWLTGVGVLLRSTIVDVSAQSVVKEMRRASNKSKVPGQRKEEVIIDGSQPFLATPAPAVVPNAPTEVKAIPGAPQTISDPAYNVITKQAELIKLYEKKIEELEREITLLKEAMAKKEAEQPK